MRYLSLMLCLLTVTAAHADVTVETIDARIRGELTALDAKTVTIAALGGPRTLRLAEVVAIRFSGQADPPKGLRVTLLGGDRYYGELVEGSIDWLTLDSPGCGRVKLPFGHVTELRYPLDPAKAATIRTVDRPDDDVLYKIDGDHVYGTVETVERKGGRFEFAISTDAIGTVRVPQSQVYRIVVRPTADAPPSGMFHAELTCWDGSTIRCTPTGLAQRILSATTLDGAPRKVSLSAIRSLAFRNGRFVYLTDLAPKKVEHTPYFDYPFPPKFDRNRRGGPLGLRGKTYARGIGMQSKTRITYALGGGFATLRCTVGIDDAARDDGSVVFRVYVDGKQVKETKIQRGGMPPLKLEIPVAGGQELTLEADYADNAHINDLADWVDPILLRKVD